MEWTADRGNAPEQWNAFLALLDKRLQLGLLTKLRNITSYHVEAEVLYIEAGTLEDEAYLKKDAVLQQLRLFAGDIFSIESVTITPLSS